MLNGLDLFSGCGMFAMGLAPWVRTVAYCECDPYAQAVLLSRMRDGSLESAPIWDDVSTLRGDMLSEPIDIITGGFPCTDISIAGHGVGLEGSRSGLFFQIVRLAGELRPRYLFLENVPAITVRGLDRVLLELTALGFDCRWTIVSAAEMGAPHLRERWFLLANSNGSGSGYEREEMERSNAEVGLRPEAIPVHAGFKVQASDPCGEGRQRWIDASTAWEALAIGSGSGGWPSWLPQPAIRRGDDGHAYRMDALRCLGNGVPPQVYREAFERLSGVAMNQISRRSKVP